jgi:hypothetical protein
VLTQQLQELAIRDALYGMAFDKKKLHKRYDNEGDREVGKVPLVIFLHGLGSGMNVGLGHNAGPRPGGEGPATHHGFTLGSLVFIELYQQCFSPLGRFCFERATTAFCDFYQPQAAAAAHYQCSSVMRLCRAVG